MENKSLWYYIGIPLIIVAFILKYVAKIFKHRLDEVPFIQYFAGIFFIVLGFFFIIAVYEQYDYLVFDYKYRFFKKIFRETGIKIFYYLLGGFLIFLGFTFLI